MEGIFDYISDVLIEPVVAEKQTSRIIRIMHGSRYIDMQLNTNILYNVNNLTSIRHCGLDPQSHTESAIQGIPGRARNDASRKRLLNLLTLIFYKEK